MKKSAENKTKETLVITEHALIILLLLLAVAVVAISFGLAIISSRIDKELKQIHRELRENRMQ